MSTKKIIVMPTLLQSKIKNKTRKNVPESSNTDLKRRLLKRIKEHKQLDSKPLDSKPLDLEIETNDFKNSLEYLSLLKQKNELSNKTMKNYEQEKKQPIVFLDLPEELMKPEQFITNIQINRNDGIPYSNLKNGTKPLYRDWSKTVRNYPIINLTNPINNLTNEPINNPINTQQTMINEPINKPINTQQINPPIINNPIINTPITIPTITNKRTTYKTIKRKYTLGKSLKNRSVGVLLKDKKSNATIIDAQKALKNKTITDVKQYLREHNLISGGGNTPNDVLRKLYESAMMAGEITNSNKETLLENISSMI